MGRSTPTNWSLQVLSTLSSDTDPCVLISFEQDQEKGGGTAKYVFNVGENTSRAFTQSRTSWNGTRAIFLTGIGRVGLRSPRDRVGGLSSLLMTLADGGHRAVQVVGPPGINHLLATQREFIYRGTLEVQLSEVPLVKEQRDEQKPILKDGNLTVYAIPIIPTQHPPPKSSNNLKRKRTDDDQDDDSENDTNNKVDIVPNKKLNTVHIPSSINSKTFDVNMTDAAPSTLSTSSQSRSDSDWLAKMIDTMFPARTNPKGASTQPSRSEKQTKADSSKPKTDPGEDVIDEYKRSSLPKKFHEQLPKCNLSSAPGNPSSALEKSILSLKPSSISICYLAIGPMTRGKFDALKASNLGVPSGPLRAALTRGETISFKVTGGSDGERLVTVKPEEVIAPSIPPAAALILDIPSTDYIPSLSLHETMSRFVPIKKEDYHLHTIIHLLGEGVLDHPRYREFMLEFDSEVHHIISSPSHLADPITFTSSAYQQLKLSQLDPEIFRVPKFRVEPKKILCTLPEGLGLPKNVSLLRAHMVIPMRPLGPPQKETWAEGLDRFHPVVTQTETQTPTILDLEPHTATAFASARAAVAQYAALIETRVDWEDISILTLGTGSAVPGKYRNVSATVIQIPGWGNILLDCGEGTWGQLCRMFGTSSESQSNVYTFLCSLKLIYISHVHADHHLGLAKLLAMRNKLDPPPKDPVYLVTIRAVHMYLRELSDLEDLGIGGVCEDGNEHSNGLIPVLSPALHWKQANEYMSTGMWAIGGTEKWLDIRTSRMHALQMCRSLNLRSFTTVDVRHRTRCYGCVIQSNDGWSVVFSGDTTPSDSLVYAARAAVKVSSSDNSNASSITLLIHEATMSDSQASIAAQKAHSTIGQAVNIGRRMRAENVLLTHFSARLPKIPHGVFGQREFVVSTSGDRGPEGTGVDGKSSRDTRPFVATAFDYAHFTLGSMWKMQFYLEGIEESYREILEGDDAEEEK